MKTVKKRTTPTVLTDPTIFKSYDIRGKVPDQLNANIAYAIGRAVATYLNPKTIAVGRDVRLSSDELTERLVSGLTRSGVDVIDLGLVSTDGMYFAVGKYGYDGGIMVTASHNPAAYNGFKICRKDAVPLSGEKGIQQIRDIITTGDYRDSSGTGKVIPRDIADDYTMHALSFVDRDKLFPATIVIDAGNGIGGLTLPGVFGHLPQRIIPMYFEPDGRFPNHPASPIEPENTEELRKRVVEEGADFGAAFDGDADRMFLVDDKGRLLGGDVVVALVAKALLQKEPGATILYNAICSKMVPEIITKYGGNPIKTPVGHALIKPLMKEHNAVFGGEHSGHFYFRNNWFADSGLIALLVCLEVIGQARKPLSELVAKIDPYFRSGEINSTVTDAPAVMKKIRTHYKDEEPDLIDGVSIDFDDWWFNVRSSNTEPLLRLNVEASSPELLEEKTEEVLALIRGRKKTKASE
jgi:phosphomannomutase